MIEKTSEFNVGTSASEDKVQLTREGFKELNERHRELIDVIRPATLIELEEARALGDLSENAEYDAAKDKQAEIEAEIRKIEDVLTRAEVLVASRAKTISVGSKLAYKKAGDRKDNSIIIVGPVEVDVMAETPKVASNSPLAQALLGAKEGETVTVQTQKPYSIKISKVN